MPVANMSSTLSGVQLILNELDNKELRGQEQEVKQLKDLFLQTLSRGESNSVLLLGPRGCGKTHLLEHVLDQLTPGSEDWLLVKLHGLVQTDDRLALKEMTRQLKLENVVGERVFGSFAEHLDFLLASLRSGDKRSKPIVFMLDEFHLFTQHGNQTLLYNLFDVAQSRAVPVLVVGVTARIDVVESMEKRVKSRFCHRAVHLSKVKTAEEYMGLVKHFLTAAPKTAAGNKSWDRMITNFLSARDVKKFFESVFLKDSSPGFLKKLILTSLMWVDSMEDEELDVVCFENALKDLAPNYNEVSLNGLSVLDLTLVIAAKHLTTLYEEESFNFEMVYAEYHKFVSRKCSALLSFDRSVVMKSWETLISLEIVRALDRSLGGGRVQAEYRQYALDVRPDEVERVASSFYGLPLDVKEWATCGISGV